MPISLKNLFKGQLRFMKNQGIDVLGVSSPGLELQNVGKVENIRTVAISMTRKITPFKDFLSLFRMIVLFSKEKPDIVHSHTPKAGIISMCAAWICQVPIMMHTVAGLPLEEAEGVKYILLFYIEKVTYFFATKIYPNSSSLQDYILQNKMVNSKKCSIIGNGGTNGIDVNFFYKENVDPTEIQKIKELYALGSEVYCYVGRIVKDKGIVELINAFILLLERKPEAQLLLIGDYEESLDPLPCEIFEFIQESDKIINVGWVEDVRPYMLSSNYFVFPSYREGFPNVVLQAQALGLRSIVSNINGCNEIVEHNRNGYIVEKKNTHMLYEYMLKISNPNSCLIGEKDQRKRIEKLYSSKFIWRELYKEYQTLYNLSNEKVN